MLRQPIIITFALTAVACASAPRAMPAVIPTFEQKMASILRLEDQRVLRDPASPVAAGSREPAAVIPPAPPDLVRLLADNEARIRRRAALAIGRVGLHDGTAPLVALLNDADPEVRYMGAFGLGLIGDRAAVRPLVKALGDLSPSVQGGAAEALGLLGDVTAAEAVGRLASQIVQSGALAEPPGDDADTRRDLPASAFRAALYTLVRLKAYDHLAAAVLDGAGQPKVRWWPVAYALQRIDDERALPALLTLANETHPYTRAFAAKGLGGLKDASAVPVLIGLLASPETAVVVESVRALGRIGDRTAADMLVKLVREKDTNAQVRREALEALGSMLAPGVFDVLLDSFADPNPAIRAAAIRSAAALDPEQFVAVLSGLDPDPDWSVRAAVASVLGTLPRDIALAGLMARLGEKDQRVVPAVLAALVKLRPADLVDILVQHLKADDAAVRAAAANGLGDIRPPNAQAALADAYQFGQRDGSYSARATVLAALAKYGAATATPVLKAALTDKDWAVRLRAAMLLKQLDPESAADVDQEIRPAPTTLSAATYRATRLANPSISTAAFLDTDHGTIEVELAVLDAPLTVENFVTLARKGYFDGLTVHRVVPDFVIQGGDPRGDGEGGPGYTIPRRAERTCVR